MKRSFMLASALIALVAMFALPTMALGFTITGGAGTATQNPYGLWYAGQEACGIEGCHSSIVAKPSPHSTMVTDVHANPGALLPASSSLLWPYTSPFGGITIRPRDIYLQIGDRFGFFEYAGMPGSSLATPMVPSDDLPLWSPMEYEAGSPTFDAPTGPLTNSGYSSCADCHNLGVTRPSNTTTTLPNGAVMTSTTPVSVSALSIQCEVCHGTGKDPSVSAHQPGVPAVVAGTQILKAQVCGQCHVSGTTPQKNLAGSAFGNPNGYTTDATLSAYFTPYTTVPSETAFMNYINGVTKTKPYFLPNGDDYSMRHDYYNEWLVSSHAAPTNSHVQTSSTATLCERCHSGLGFLYRIDARSPQGKRIVPTQPTTATVMASDPGISCQVCHTGHIGYTATGYDLMRRWGNGKEVACTDCHNWQYEQLNQTLQYEAIGGVQHARPVLNGKTSHPVREMFSGGSGGDDGTGGMWGVAPMGQFMPGTTCTDCHMPRTYKEGMPANDDGSTGATRVSHGFKIVYPGDAIRYKLRNGGDSCTQADCHTGEAEGWSRTDFQAWIDQKKAEIATASVNASSALIAFGSDYGITTYSGFESAEPTKGAAANIPPSIWAMLQHAAQNVNFVSADGSFGMHNPDYAAAGLAKALYWAQSAGATVTASIDPIGDGEGMDVTGTLLGTHGVVIGGAQVVLQSSGDGGSTWSFVATGTPDGTGAFSIPTGRIVGDTLFRVVFTPDANNTFSSAQMSVTVPVTVAALMPTAAQSGWVDAPSVTTSLSVTPGASITFYSLSGATTQAQTIYTGPFAVTAPGETDVAFWSSNADGVEAVQTQRVLIDRDTPVLASDAAASYTDAAVVKVWASDQGCVADLEYSLDGAPTVSAPGTWTSLTVTAPGAHTLAASATDGCGHAVTKTWSFAVKATPHFGTQPSAYRSSVTHGRTWTASVTLSSARGAALQHAGVWLQRSSNGRSWSTMARLSTDGSGHASKSVRFSGRQTLYWRWYTPSSAGAFAGASAKHKLVVK